MKNCQVCDIIKSDTAEVIIEDTEHWRAALDPNQEYLGKTFITLRDHKEKISELNKEEWQELADIAKQLEPAIDKAFSPTHFNWSCLMNNAVRDSQPTHVHWHCQPRYKISIEFAGRTFVDSRWPQPARTVNPHKVSDKALKEIKKAITANLKDEQNGKES